MFFGKIPSGVNPPHDINVVAGIPGRGDKAEAILMESVEPANKDRPTRTGQQGLANKDWPTRTGQHGLANKGRTKRDNPGSGPTIRPETRPGASNGRKRLLDGAFWS